MNTLQQILLLLLFLSPGVAVAQSDQDTTGAHRGQSAPALGVVWEVPSDLREARTALQQMHERGVRAVRTGVVTDETLLILADTLGIQFFQDLPVDHLPAPSLSGAAQTVKPLLERAMVWSQRHRSARHFGLARFVDTSDSTACSYFRELARLVGQQGPTDARTYYMTPFVEADVCAQEVDFVLLDALDDTDPAALLQRWRDEHDTPVGIGALGSWVRLGSEMGLRVPHSLQTQGRYLETTLRALTDTSLDPSPVAVFVYRWADRSSSRPVVRSGLATPYIDTYGIHSADGEERPAADVLEGFFTGQQRVFAFPAGESPRGTWPWLTLLGWSLFALLGAHYAFSPRFRHMLPRYFFSHPFYQQAVREGRDVLFGGSAVLLLAQSLALGMAASICLEALRTHIAFALLVDWLPESLQSVAVTLAAQPWLLVLLVAAVYASLVLFWTVLLAVASSRRYGLVTGQTLLLTVWPRWPLLLLAAAAMVVPTLPPHWMLESVAVLVLLWLVGSVSALVRTLYDFASITKVPLYMTLLLGLFSPIVIAALAVTILLMRGADEAVFLQHLLMRT